jgi:ribosomal-protein-alanine N-acetyltransferase
MTGRALRPARPDDLTTLTTLEAQLFGADAWSEGVLADELTTVVIAEMDGDVVGYATSRVAADLADLTRIAVLPDHRRAGIGRSLVQRIKELAASGGANRMLLEVSAGNDAALNFYAAEGFVEIDRRPRYYRDGSDALVLRLTLGPGCGGGRGG